MRDPIFLKTCLTEPATRLLFVENNLFACKTLMVVLLLGSTVYGVQLAVNKAKNSPATSASLSPRKHLVPLQNENEATQFSRVENLAQRYDDAKSCRADIHTLAHTHLALNNQLKFSLATHLAKMYKIAPKHANEIVQTAATVSKDHDVDPFLVLGIIAKESSFNQTARSGYGATGLMQVHAPSHKALLKTLGLNVTNLKSTEKSLQSEMRINVTAGVQIYKQYEKQYESRAKALQAYNGAKNDVTLKYAKSVLALRDAFSSEAAVSKGCDKAGYAFMNTSKQKLDFLHQRRHSA